MKVEESLGELGIFKVLFDGSTFVMTGYANNFGTYSDAHSYFFGFIQKFSLSNDQNSCIELIEITDLTDIDPYPFETGDIKTAISNIGTPTRINPVSALNNVNLITVGLADYTVEDVADFEVPENLKPCPLPFIELYTDSMLATVNQVVTQELDFYFSLECDATVSAVFNDPLDTGYTWTFDTDNSFAFEATDEVWIG